MRRLTWCWSSSRWKFSSSSRGRWLGARGVDDDDSAARSSLPTKAGRGSIGRSHAALLRVDRPIDRFDRFVWREGQHAPAATGPPRHFGSSWGVKPPGAMVGLGVSRKRRNARTNESLGRNGHDGPNGPPRSIDRSSQPRRAHGRPQSWGCSVPACIYSLGLLM
jgi:hypothetical protein